MPNSEFSETPNQAYFYANFWFCTRTFPAGDSNLRQFFFYWRVSNSLKTPEDDSGSQNLASATKDQKIAANPVIKCPVKMVSSRRDLIELSANQNAAQRLRLYWQDNNYAYANLRRMWSIGFTFSKCV